MFGKHKKDNMIDYSNMTSDELLESAKNSLNECNKNLDAYYKCTKVTIILQSIVLALTAIGLLASIIK